MESSSSLIWATVTIFLLAGYVFTRSIVFLVLLFVWFGRVCWLRQLFPVVQVVTLGLLFGWHFSHVSHFIGQHQKSYENVRIILNVHLMRSKFEKMGSASERLIIVLITKEFRLLSHWSLPNYSKASKIIRKIYN